MGFVTDLTLAQVILLVIGLGIAFGFEFVNGFHDTANAVATVIYTNSLKPTVAVIWSGLCNFLGVALSGIAVAYSIVNLLPVELLVEIDTNSGLALIMALLLSAILWNLGTWYLGIPASSSHALIGSILGAALIHHVLAGRGVMDGVNWSKAGEVGMSLLLSPLVGFLLAAALMFFARRIFRSQLLHSPPAINRPPPFLVRAVLIVTCTGVSFAHGSNDGQKGMGLIMLVLIGIVPAHFALNPNYTNEQIQEVAKATEDVDQYLEARGVIVPESSTDVTHQPHLHARVLLSQVKVILANRSSFVELNAKDRWALRKDLLELRRDLKATQTLVLTDRPKEERDRWAKWQSVLKKPTEYVPPWVRFGVALALGVGTTVGWRRIVITIGEKIGKSHLTYSQGACAEAVAMSTIGLADFAGLPVSTTQVLSSGVAGTMWANQSGLRAGTIKKVALAWFMTLPATMLMSCVFYAVATLCL